MAAEESLELMQFAVDRSNDSIYWLDPNARIVYANESACKRLGYTKQEMLRLTIHDIDPEFKPALWSRHWEELQRIKNHTVEVNHRTKSGDLFPVEITDTYLEYQGKEYSCVIGRDMTERLRIEEQTRLLRFSIDRVGDSAFWLDPAGRILYANIAARQRLGYDLDEFCKMTVFDVDTEFTLAMWREHWQELKSKRMDTVHTFHRTRDGEVFPVEVLVNFFDYGGKEYNCAFARDISKRKQQQQELESARKAAEEANSAKSSFLANLSHEFRTPLSSIVGMTGLMLEGDLDSEQLEYATTVRHSADALLTLINDLIDLAKIESGNLSINLAAFAPSELLRDSMALLQTQASAQKIELIAHCHQNLPIEIVADNDRLRQVITNLLGNAVKYSGGKSVFLDLRLTQSKAGADCLRCEVRDNGAGIDTADQARIFDKFFQTSGNNQQSGAGLGLAIAKQLIELMGGTINVESRRGHGAKFWFEIPVTILEPAHVSEVRMRKNVLVVSAHVELANAIKNSVAEIGGGAEYISDASELTRLLGATRDDLEYHHAIVDAQSLWSEMNTVIAKIRAAWPNCAVLTLNAVGNSFPLPDSDSVHPLQHLTRPFLLNEVIDNLLAPIAENTQSVAAQTITQLRNTSDVGKLILVVEDNPVNQKVALRMLEKLGCDVDLAGNGIEALERLDRRDYDMVLMDCQMPRLDGYDTTREIRRLEGSDKHTLIVAMTAHAMQGDRERCLAAGMDEYLAKPIKLSDLKTLIEKLDFVDRTLASAN
jgi:PAS domain S-box-containing protein